MNGVKQLASWSTAKIKLIQFLLRKERDTIYPKLSGTEVVENRVELYEWKTLMEEKLTEIKADAILSPVLEICATHMSDFRVGPSYLHSGMLNFMEMTGGSVPFGRVT